MTALWLQPDAQSKPIAAASVSTAFTPEGNRSYYPEAIKRQAIARRIAGMGYSAISRVPDVKPDAICSWIKKAIQTMAALEAERAAAAAGWGCKDISFADMWTYVGVRCGDKRNSRWIWTTVADDASGNRRKDFEVGDRIGGALLRLLE